METKDLVEALRKRAEIRRQIPTRKSVQEGKPDRISDLLEEAARHLEMLESKYAIQTDLLRHCTYETGKLRSHLDFLQEYPCWIGKTFENKTTLECVLPDGQYRIIAANLREAIQKMKKE